MLQVADSHGMHSRLDMRTSHHVALVNRENSCGLSSAEIVASGSGWGIGWMGERQDWPIIALFLDYRSRQGRLGHEMLVITWLTALREETEKAKGGSMHSYRILFWCPGACNDGMAVVKEWRFIRCAVSASILSLGRQL